MQASDVPVKISVAFANSGTKNTIPVASSPTPGLASYTTGFPPVTFQPLAAGGIPPAGADFNGVLNALSAIQRWQSAGAGFKYDAAFSTAVSGYPKGAILQSTNADITWISTVDNNTADPDGATPTGWVSLDAFGITAVTGLTNANVTLSATQAARPVLTLAGLLTGNVQIIFPVTQGPIRVFNNTTGAFTVTCKTAAGTGSVVTQGGGEQYYGDGTNLVPLRVSTQAPGDNSTKPASTAYADAAVAALGASRYVQGVTTATTSGTSKNITGIPSWAKRITLMFNGVSFNATEILRVQIGPVAGVETTGYQTFFASIGTGGGTLYITSTTDLRTANVTGGNFWYGAITLTLQDAATNTWAISGNLGCSDIALAMSGCKSLAGPLTQFTVSGAAASTFDAGSFSYSYEG